MKQHITIEQLKELKTDDKICKLNTLMNHKWDLSGEEFKKYSWGKVLEDTAKYCTIGRMIEMLMHKDDCLNIDSHTIYIDGKWQMGWHIMLRQFDKWYEALELCDALWKAVKDILKEDVR